MAFLRVAFLRVAVLRVAFLRVAVLRVAFLRVAFLRVAFLRVALFLCAATIAFSSSLASLNVLVSPPGGALQPEPRRQELSHTTTRDDAGRYVVGPFLK